MAPSTRIERVTTLRSVMILLWPDYPQIKVIDGLFMVIYGRGVLNRYKLDAYLLPIRYVLAIK